MPMVLTDGTTISDHLSEECYNRAVDIYKPIMWQNLISNPDIENTDAKAELGVDMYFLTDAHKTGKTIYEIESAAEQVAVLGNLSMQLQVLLLEETVFSYNDRYCTLYALGNRCGGNFTYTEEGIKDCTNCLRPHKRENYDKIVAGRDEVL